MSHSAKGKSLTWIKHELWARIHILLQKVFIRDRPRLLYQVLKHLWHRRMLLIYLNFKRTTFAFFVITVPTLINYPLQVLLIYRYRLD